MSRTSKIVLIGTLGAESSVECDNGGAGPRRGGGSAGWRTARLQPVLAKSGTKGWLAESTILETSNPGPGTRIEACFSWAIAELSASELDASAVPTRMDHVHVANLCPLDGRVCTLPVPSEWSGGQSPDKDQSVMTRDETTGHNDNPELSVLKHKGDTAQASCFDG
ncbi:hypothetical protein Micbo1qcDRAFT_220897 [Microdochium bolleyi]|uniref:Uncharacterized protein n=1 Tax=Microdochium bolleyi TaxID=196109 RepID=A0A136JAY0_9PEZI|nr:hypothetical protein Micbo1qcDRAFT_220897 [Microdochium bolleyi]